MSNELDKSSGVLVVATSKAAKEGNMQDQRDD
jgi:hypothetical protein